MRCVSFIADCAVESGEATRTQKGAGASTNPFLQHAGHGGGPGAGPPPGAAGAAAPACQFSADNDVNANPLLFVNAHASAADGSRRSSGERLGVHARHQQEEQQLLIRVSDERMRSSSTSGACADGRHCLPLERAYSENPSTSRLIVNVPDAVALQIASADPSRGIYIVHVLDSYIQYLKYLLAETRTLQYLNNSCVIQIVHYLVANKPQILNVAECTQCSSPFDRSQSPRLLRPAMYGTEFINNSSDNCSGSVMPATAEAVDGRPGSCTLDEVFSVAGGGGLVVGGGGGGRAFLRPHTSEPHSPSGSLSRHMSPESLARRMSPARSMKELEAACDSMIDAISGLENVAKH